MWDALSLVGYAAVLEGVVETESASDGIQRCDHARRIAVIREVRLARPA